MLDFRFGDKFCENEEVGSPLAKCPKPRNLNTKVTAIYPVRYAYANFFTEQLSTAAEPPALSVLLNADMRTGKGYVIRLLREGWVYLREEDDPAKGNFQIFKYQKIEKNGELTEKFSKYQFKNKLNAQDGLVLDTSGSGGSYPFVFVNKELTHISIAYSEHEWHADVIDRLNQSASERARSMQRINLKAEDKHTLPATHDNFSKLIEDYRKRQNRLLQIKNTGENPDIKDLSLDILTTESSYDLNAENIAIALQKKTAFTNTARIVALYDPVGRQREIVQVMAKLAVWEKDVASTQIYPYTIGKIVNDLRQSKDKKTQKMAEESINWTEHGTHWGKMQQEFKAFEQRQKQFAKLYQDFMFGGPPNQVGSLATYFNQFFCQQPSKDSADAEWQKLCDISAEMVTGMLSTPPAKQALEAVINDAAQQAEDAENSPNAYYALWKVLEKIVTANHKGFEWSEMGTKALNSKRADKLLLGIGWLYGEALALYHHGVKGMKRSSTTLTFKAIQFIVDKNLPPLLHILGLVIDEKNKIHLTQGELGRLLAALLNKKGHALPVPEVQTELRQASKMFNWSNTPGQGELRYTFAQITVKHPRLGSLYGFVVDPNTRRHIGLAFEPTFAGLGVFVGAQTMCNLLLQTDYDRSDPLAGGSSMYYVIQYTATISSLIIDTATAIEKGISPLALKGLEKAPLFARALAPGIQGGAQHLGRFLASKLGTRIIAITNLAGAIASGMDAYKSWNRGNYGEATGNVMIAIGSGMLFGQAVAALAIGGATAGPIGLAVVIIGLVLIGIGIAVAYYFTQDPFEILLKNCFWGNGDRYAFWGRSRPAIETRLSDARNVHTLEKIQGYYQTELQEFMNYLNMPQLKIEADSNWFNLKSKINFKYTFNLPNFQQGVSELFLGLAAGGRVDYAPDLHRAIVNAMKTPSGFRLEQGAAILEVTVQLPRDARLYWYYAPQPDTVVPMRRLNNDGKIEVDDKGKIKVAYGMKNESPL